MAPTRDFQFLAICGVCLTLAAAWSPSSLAQRVPNPPVSPSSMEECDDFEAGVKSAINALSNQVSACMRAVLQSGRAGVAGEYEARCQVRAHEQKNAELWEYLSSNRRSCRQQVAGRQQEERRQQQAENEAHIRRAAAADEQRQRNQALASQNQRNAQAYAERQAELQQSRQDARTSRDNAKFEAAQSIVKGLTEFLFSSRDEIKEEVRVRPSKPVKPSRSVEPVEVPASPVVSAIQEAASTVLLRQTEQTERQIEQISRDLDKFGNPWDGASGQQRASSGSSGTLSATPLGANPWAAADGTVAVAAVSPSSIASTEKNPWDDAGSTRGTSPSSVGSTEKNPWGDTTPSKGAQTTQQARQSTGAANAIGEYGENPWGDDKRPKPSVARAVGSEVTTSSSSAGKGSATFVHPTTQTEYVIPNGHTLWRDPKTRKLGVVARDSVAIRGGDDAERGTCSANGLYMVTPTCEARRAASAQQ